MNNTKRISAIVILVLLCCGVMAMVDGIWQPNYAVKSGVKLLLFLACPLVYSSFDKKLRLKDLFRFDKKGFKIALMLCIPLYILIVGGYLLLKNVFDFSAITDALMGNVGVNGENFVFVALYISFINSLLEEFFFRGFAFLGLKNFVNEKTAYIFSAAAFAVYHIAIMTGWFSVGLFILIMAGLFAGGLIFNFLNSKSNNIYTSWLVHMFANFAINTIGFMLFGII